MKVLMISTDKLIFKTGSEVRRRMMDYGDLFEELRVIILTKDTDNFSIEKLTDNVTIEPTNSRFRLFSLIDAYKFTSRCFRTDRASWVITSQDPFETGLVGFLLSLRFGYPWQAQIHTDLGSSFFRWESLLNFCRFILAYCILPQARGIRVVSERIKKYLVNEWGLTRPISVLPIFVSEQEKDGMSSGDDDLRKKYPQFDFIVLMASRLTQEKNLPLALGAFAEAARNRPDIGLVIVGAGPEYKNLLNLIKAMGLEEQVFLEDWSCHLMGYYQSADLFLLSSNYEGYGRTLVEAGLMGCPILTADIGLVGELATVDDVLVCSMGDEDCFAEKIGWAVSHRTELEKMATNFRQRLTENLLSKEKYLKMFKESLNF